MKNIKIFFIIVALATISSLLTVFFKFFGSRNSQYQDYGAISEVRLEPEFAKVGMMPPIYDNDMVDIQDRVYHSSSSYSVVVNDVSNYLNDVKDYLTTIDGVLLNSSFSSSKYTYGSLYFKVPVSHFNETNTKISQLAKTVVSETVNSRDITGQKSSSDNNLQSLKASKAIKQAELKEAKTESERTRLRIAIERLDKQIEYAKQSVNRVEQQIEYAEVNLDVGDSARYFNPNTKLSVKEEVIRAFESLLLVIKSVFYFFIWVVVYSIAWLPIVILVTWIVKKVKK